MKNQMYNNIFEIIKNKIDSENIFQPILFLWENLEVLNNEIQNLVYKLFEYYEIDKNNLYKLVDNNEKIKISELRDFISKSNIKSSFKFQVFLIENISRATLESANASLKFLEEPWLGNIIFLTNASESWILETILSRVQIMDVFTNLTNKKNEFYFNLIDEYINKKNTNLIKYFFADKKLEKSEYIDFLNTFLLYIKQNLVFVDLADQVVESLNLIQKNNVLPKYEIDKLLLKI